MFSGSSLPQLKKTWKDWKQGAFKDSLRQTLLSSLHFLVLSLLWASSMPVEAIYSTFPACSLKGPAPSLFLSKLLEGRDPEMLGPHGGKPRFLKRAAQESHGLSQEWGLNCIVLNHQHYRAYLLRQLTATLRWLVCSSSSVVSEEWQV